MTAWTEVELAAIGAAEELQIASLRRDGTRRDPVTIWVVRHGDGLYVRAVRGPSSPWFRGARTRREGQVRSGGVTKDVTFADAEDALADQIEAAYRAKYRRYAASIVDSTVSPAARAATIRLVPRATIAGSARVVEDM